MCLNSDWTPKACRSPMGLHRHVSLQLSMSIYDQACRSPMKHVEVSDKACRDLRWVSDLACRSPLGLRWVSDRSTISLR